MDQYFEQKTREKHFSCAAAAKSKSKGKGKETVNIASDGQQKVNVFEEISVEWNTIQSIGENMKEHERVRDRPAGKRNSDRKEAFRKGKPSQHASPSERVIVRKGMPVIIGTHLSVLGVRKEIANLGVSVRSSVRKNAGGDLKE